LKRNPLIVLILGPILFCAAAQPARAVDTQAMTGWTGLGEAAALGPVAPPATIISACGEITQSGNYILNSDLQGTSGSTCLIIHDTSNIHLDCQGHTISGVNVPSTISGTLEISSVTLFSVTGCKLSVAQGWALNIQRSHQGIISNNTIQGLTVSSLYDSIGSSQLQVLNNTFTGEYYQAYTDDSIVSNNVFNLPTNDGSGISSQNGANNLIIANTIFGNWNGGDNLIGADDGIVLGNETGTIVKQNTIYGVFDCGIETVYMITNVTIQGNTIQKSGVSGIGSWYGTNWQNNLVDNNTVTQSSSLFLFYRIYDLLPGENHMYFQNNQFTGNHFSSPMNPIGPAATFDFETMGTTIPVAEETLASNTFSNNDFDLSELSPIFLPETMIIDGGGNLCSASSDPAFPLACGSSSATGTATVSLPAPSFAPSSQLPVTASLDATYPGSYGVEKFNWLVTSMDPMMRVQDAMTNLAPQTQSSNPQPVAVQADLGSLHLSPGHYHVTVDVTLKNGMISPSAAADITLLGAANTSQVNVYPNPWKASLGVSYMKFDSLPTGSTIKIYTVSGHWIKTLSASGGSAPWDLTNDSGEKVASGIYLYLITDPQGDKINGKAIVIR